MTTLKPRELPSDAEFDQMISGAHQKINRVTLARPHQGCQRRNRSRAVAAGVAALAVAGGGAAVANVGPFAPTDSGNYSNVQGPAGMDGKPAAGRGENAITTTPWPKNDFGLTFGEPTRADVLAHNLPDLIPVITENGDYGFWRSEDAYTYTGAGNVETLPEHLNVYGPDGKTLLGGRELCPLIPRPPDSNSGVTSYAPVPSHQCHTAGAGRCR
ncbi:hypothetical protein [Aeromicrobium sp. UC242_57]|uniref:hypothetical protein n=1 Tax=Aeromicrobium sp. UC242_57 TaxID=3374624 RepID=UPI00378C317B